MDAHKLKGLQVQLVKEKAENENLKLEQKVLAQKIQESSQRIKSIEFSKNCKIKKVGFTLVVKDNVVVTIED